MDTNNAFSHKEIYTVEKEYKKEKDEAILKEKIIEDKKEKAMRFVVTALLQMLLLRGNFGIKHLL